MHHSSARAQPARRARRIVLTGLVAFGLAIAAYLVQPSGVASTLSGPAVDADASSGAAGPLGEADGVVPEGETVSVFDDTIPAVGRLDPALLDAVRRAATAAGSAGVRLGVSSGWRSPAYQQQLLQDAVVEHGSPAEAARWVATPDRSAHVSGDAVDVGPYDAAAWLAAHGAAYGLCRIYGNEPWHFELRPDAVDDGCPPMYADPTRDPRTEP
jgi:hypothetical protein